MHVWDSDIQFLLFLNVKYSHLYQNACQMLALKIGLFSAF